jgi:hypothetical protein
MSRCENCGCGMSGGFCSNCHEEIFIAEQYGELGMDVPQTIAHKASEHINDPDRVRQAEKIRQQEERAREEASEDFWGSTPA